MRKDPLDFTIRELIALGYEVKHLHYSSSFDDKVLVISPIYRLVAKIRRLIKGEK